MHHADCQRLRAGAAGNLAPDARAWSQFPARLRGSDAASVADPGEEARARRVGILLPPKLGHVFDVSGQRVASCGRPGQRGGASTADPVRARAGLASSHRGGHGRIGGMGRDAVRWRADGEARAGRVDSLAVAAPGPARRVGSGPASSRANGYRHGLCPTRFRPGLFRERGQPELGAHVQRRLSG